MAARNGARYLAPIALVATVLAILLLATNELGAKHATVHTTQHHLVSLGGKRPVAKPQYYVVQSGDSLSTISAKTGVSVNDLETLNPSVNPSALQTGQRLQLRR